MSKSKSILKNRKDDDDDQSDSDASLKRYGISDDLMTTSSSSSTTSKSSPIASLEPKKMFLKKPTPKRDEFKFEEQLKLTSSDDNDPLKSRLRRPLNPLAKPDIQQNALNNSLGSTMPDRRDETPLSTIKFGSDTLDEEQEKADFFRNIEQNKGESTIDYGVLNQNLDFDLSHIRNGAVLESFDKQITQMSTPLRSQPNNELVKESISNELDREIEHELQKLNKTTTTTTTVKHVTIKEPVVRPSASADDFSRTNKTVSDCLSSTTDTTRDLNMLHNVYKQNLNSVSTTRTSRSQTFDPKKKIQPTNKPTTKVVLKSNIQTPTKKSSPGPVVSQPKPKEPNNKDTILIEQLKTEKELLITKIESLETVYQEQLRQLGQENLTLNAKITQLTNLEGKTEILPVKQREVSELEKLLDSYQNENEKLCKQIKQFEQQHKQIEQSMFNENEKLRQELIQTKMFLEQYHLKKQSSTIVLTNLVQNDQEQTNENEKLKTEILSLKKQLTEQKQSKYENEDNSKSSEQKRIRDLERQVKELEIINRRHQHNPTTQVGLMFNPSNEQNQFNAKLVQTEDILREKLNSEEKLLHELSILEEKYTLLKQMYSKHGQTTNEQFERHFQDIITKTNKHFTGQNQLRKENERLKSELEKLQTQQVPKPAKSLKRDLETIKFLRIDLERKNDELDKLRALYDAVNVQHKSLLAEREREKTRLAIMGNKPYQPDRFTQNLTPIETLQEENEQLKHLVEKLEHDSRDQHVELMSLKEDRQSAIHLALREKDQEIVRLRQQHKQELQTIINEMSSNTSETRISDLMKKIQIQESTILQLKKFTEHADENARQLAVLRIQDEEYKSTINRLEQELLDARSYHTPAMKHFQELQNQIQQLEQRWHKREQLTKDYKHSLVKQHDIDTNNDVIKLRAIIKQKNQEIERFHIELDSMLELLKTLKFQQLLNNQ